MLSELFPFPKERAPHLIAHCLHICSPETAFRYYPTLEIRSRCYNAPGVLFPFGKVQLPGESSRSYYGGFCRNRSLFLLVPYALYEHRRRIVLWQLAQERLATTHRATLHAYCKQAERELAEGIPPPDHIALLAEASARHVRYWIRLLASRQEPFDPRWDWRSYEKQ